LIILNLELGSDLKVMVKCLEFYTHWNFCNSKVFFLAVPTSVLKNVATSLDAGLGEAREVRRTRHVKQLLSNFHSQNMSLIV